MKKYGFLAGLLLLFAIFLISPAFAAEGYYTVTGSVVQTSVGADGDAVYSITVSGTEKDALYTLYLIRGIHSTVPSEVEDDDVLYFTDMFADGDSIVFEGIIPKTADDFTAIAVSAASQQVVGTYKKTEAAPESPDVPSSPNKPDVPVAPPAPSDDAPAKVLVIGVSLGLVAIAIIVVLVIQFKKYLYR